MNTVQEILHADDGTRYHECANYEGTVHQCLCGERFVDMSELTQHITEEGCSGCAGDVENPEEEELGEQVQILGIWAASAAFSLSFWWMVWHWVGPVVARLL